MRFFAAIRWSSRFQLSGRLDTLLFMRFCFLSFSDRRSDKRGSKQLRNKSLESNKRALIAKRINKWTQFICLFFLLISKICAFSETRIKAAKTNIKNPNLRIRKSALTGISFGTLSFSVIKVRPFSDLWTHMALRSALADLAIARFKKLQQANRHCCRLIVISAALLRIKP